jgi:hypothetical protein
MRFITSLSPKNVPKCRECVDSWIPFSSEIVAVQTESEVPILQPLFPEVTFVVTDRVGVVFESTYCPNIHTLVDQGPGLIINADISIRGHKQMFDDRFCIKPKILDCGIRWDYDSRGKQLNPYGIDAFRIDEELITILQGTDFTIGQPGWDYYFILEAEKHGFYINAHKNPPMFYHELHEVNWSRWKLTLAQALLEKMYDMPQSDVTRKVQRLTNRVTATRKKYSGK